MQDNEIICLLFDKYQIVLNRCQGFNFHVPSRQQLHFVKLKIPFNLVFSAKMNSSFTFKHLTQKRLNYYSD